MTFPIFFLGACGMFVTQEEVCEHDREVQGTSTCDDPPPDRGSTLPSIVDTGGDTDTDTDSDSDSDADGDSDTDDTAGGTTTVIGTGDSADTALPPDTGQPLDTAAPPDTGVLPHDTGDTGAPPDTGIPVDTGFSHLGLLCVTVQAPVVGNVDYYLFETNLNDEVFWINHTAVPVVPNTVPFMSGDAAAEVCGDISLVPYNPGDFMLILGVWNNGVEQSLVAGNSMVGYTTNVVGIKLDGVSIPGCYEYQDLGVAPYDYTECPMP